MGINNGAGTGLTYTLRHLTDNFTYTQHTTAVRMETAQPLHPESKAMVDRIAQLDAKPYNEMATIDEARARSKLVSTVEAVAGRVDYDGTRKELFVSLPDFTGTLRYIVRLTSTS